MLIYTPSGSVQMLYIMYLFDSNGGKILNYHCVTVSRQYGNVYVIFNHLHQNK